MINKMDFPLKANFFPQVRLSNDEKNKYLRTVEASAVALRRSLDKGDWKKLFDKEGVTFSKLLTVSTEMSPPAQTRGSAKNGGPNGAAQACIAVCATIYTSGTISEVLEAIASPVTEDYRRAMKFIYKTRFLDGLGLHTIVPTTGASNPQAFTTIKWAAFDDGKAHNSPKFPVGSDYCFLEHSGIQHDESQENNIDSNDDEVFGFSIQESIVREREVPSLAGFGLRRGEFRRSGIIILPTERRDVVQVSSIIQMSLLGSDSAANKTALERLMLRRVEAIGRIDVLLERRRLSKMQFINRDEWVADEDRKSCAVCVKPFNIRRRHHCRNCGEVVCSACAPPREVDVSSYGSALIRICTACVVQARSEPQLQAGGNQDVFVYHIRSTLSSRTSTNSSNLAGDDHDDNGATLAPRRGDGTGPAASNATRSFSFCSDDSNFSIASEYPTQQSMAAAPVAHVPMYQQHNHQQQQYNHYQQQQQQQVQPMTFGSSEFLNDEYDDVDDYEDNNYYLRDSQSSSGSSSYSFSDYNACDDRFGSAIMKCLPPPQAQASLRGSTSSYNRYSYNASNNGRSSNDFGGRTSQSHSKQVLYQHQQPEVVQTRAAAPVSPAVYKRERSVYNPAKVVTHLLNLSNQDDEEEEYKEADEPEAPVPVLTVPHRDDSLDSLGDFDECIRGLKEDIFRATTTARFSDLEPADDSFCSDLASLHSDLLSSNTDPLASAAPAPAPSPTPTPVLSSPPSRPQRLTSTCSSPSTVDVDIDMLTSDSFSLICPDLLQRQRRSSSAASSRKQEAGENRRTRVSSLSRYSGNSVFDDDLEGEENEDNNAGNDGYKDEDENQDDDEEDPESDLSLQRQADLEALRRQVQGLHRSLEDATSKLNYYQSRSGKSRSSWRRGSAQSATSNTSSTRSGGGSRGGDPVLTKRSETYDALVSELHEIMGLPTLSPRGRASRTTGFWT